MKDFEDEMLMAFVDGELDPATRADIAAAILENPDLAARAGRFAASAEATRAVFANLLAAPPPERLVSAITHAPVPFPKPRARPAFALPLAASVALLIGLGAGVLVSGLVTPNAAPGLDGQLVAALASAPAGTAVPVTEVAGAGEVVVTGSYLVTDGMCRTFTASLTERSLSGVGCDRGGGYTLDVTVAGPPAGSFALASDTATATIASFLDTVGAGQPLSADEERARFSAPGG